MLNAKLKLNPDAVSSHDNDIFFVKFVNDIFKKWSSKRTSEKKGKQRFVVYALVSLIFCSINKN